MTTLSITADLAKKRLKVEGRVAAGEKVAVTVKGFGDKSVSNTRLRVMFAERVVAIFPLPDAETGWTKDGEDMTGVLNLNTVQAERITQFGSMGCFWVLDDVSDEVRQLYGTAEHELLKWVKRPDTDVPVDLDSFPTLIEEMQQEIATFKKEIRGEWTNYQQTISAAWTEYRNSLANLYSQFANHVSSLVNGKASAQDLNAHTGNKSNPHEVTKSQVGLENVDNTKDVDKPVSTQQQKAIASAKEHAEELVRSESRRATGKEQELQNKIDAEVRRAKSAESNLDHAIRTEKSRAEGAESELRELIKTDVRIEFDSEPTEGSQKAVRSGGIWSWVKHLVTGKLAEKRALTDRSWGASALRIKPECLPITNGQGTINTYDWSAHSIEASTETPGKFELLDANGVSAAVINPDGTVFGGDRIVFNGTNLSRGLSVAEFATDTLALTSEVWGALAALPAGFTSLYDWCVSQLAGKLDKSGGTITGDLVISANKTLTVGTRKSPSGIYSVVAGNSNTANGSYSHAEGGNNVASGPYSHAEGGNNVASGPYSHAEGGNNTAKNRREHAQGRYNVSHRKVIGDVEVDEECTLFSIGAGTSDAEHKNAVETMMDGKTFVLGVGGYDGTNPTGQPGAAKDVATVIEGKSDKSDTYTKDEVNKALSKIKTGVPGIKSGPCGVISITADDCGMSFCGDETHNGYEYHCGCGEYHSGFEEHCGDEIHSGNEYHYGCGESHNGYEAHYGDETHCGDEVHSGCEDHYGHEFHYGYEEHNGREYHYDTERHYGDVIFGVEGGCGCSSNESHHGFEHHYGCEYHYGDEYHCGAFEYHCGCGEYHSGFEEHCGSEYHGGSEDHFGLEYHEGDEYHNGCAWHYSDEYRYGYEYHCGDEEHNGSENHNGGEYHGGDEEHYGCEYHGGYEYHDGFESHNGCAWYEGMVTFNGTCTGGNGEYAGANIAVYAIAFKGPTGEVKVIDYEKVKDL